MKMLLYFGVFAVCCSIAQGLVPPAIIQFSENGTGKVNLDRPGDVKIAGFALICIASGSLDQMTFKWKHNGNNIVPQRGITFINDPKKPNQQILHIEYVSPRDDGKYQCFVNNAAGGTFSTKIRVKVTYASKFSRGENEKEAVTVNVGEPFLLKCPPHAGKYKEFGTSHLWGRRQDKKFFFLVTNKQRALLPNGDFVFLNFQQSDFTEIKGFPDGTVACIVSAANTIWDSHQFNLTIGRTLESNQFGPTFTTRDFTPKDQEQAIQGRNKELYCVAVGNPIPKITWFRLNNEKTERKEIENGKNGFLLKDLGRELKIDTVNKQQHEDGYYQCEAKSDLGTVKSNAIKLNVFVPPKWIDDPPKEFLVPIESDKTLICDALGTPPPSFKWYHNGTAFTSDDELAPNVIVDGKKLMFKNMQQANQGVYQCAVENDWGMLVSNTWVKVKASAPDIKNFGAFYLFKGTNATLKCQSDAAPQAVHTWYLNGKKIEIKGRYSLDNEGSLEIMGVKDSDEGKYKCEAKNAIGNDDAEAQATVYEKTTIFRKPPKNVFIVLDKPLDLHCEARADPRLLKNLKYKWLKDNANLKYSKRVAWLADMNVLRISEAIITDGAKYKCVAYIDAPQQSKDSASTIADVKGVPFPPTDLSITDCTNGSTVITWKKGLDNDYPTTRFIVEQESTYFKEEWKVIANISNPNKRKHTLKLTLWADLTFRMRAVNKIGPSRASTPTPKGKCVTKQGLPTMFPKNLRGIPGKAGELEIAWEAMTKLEANAPGLHYILYYGKSSNKTFLPPVTIKDPAIERFKVPNAGYFVKWKFQIVAKNNLGRGPISDIQESFSGQDAPKGKPTNVNIDKKEARSIELSWDRVNPESPGSIDGYRIYYWGKDKVSARRKRREIPPGALTFDADHTTADKQRATVTGLTPFSSYTIALKAFNSGGEGPSSEEKAFDTLEDVPGKVSTFKAYAFSSYIFASWGEPEEKNGILLGYSIAAVKHDNNEKQKPVPKSGFVDLKTNQFEYLFTKDIEKETRYVVYLIARTKIGAGPERIADLKTIAPAKPSKPRAPIVNAKTTTSVNVTFLFGESPGGYPLEFMVKYRETASNASFKETGWFNHLEKRWAIVEDLTIDRLHDFITVGRNKEGTSVDSPITKARPLPAVGAGKRVSTPFYKTPWFIILLVLILLLIILLLVAVLYTRKRGAKYPVGKREKARAGILDPDEEDMIDMGPMDDNPPPYPSQGSLEKPNMSDDDRDSLDDYGEGPQFKEDGSFIEEYGDDKKKLSDDRDKSATATFV